MPIVGFHAFASHLAHGFAQLAARAHAFHGAGKALAVHRRHVEAGHAEVVAFLAFQQFTAAAHVGGHARAGRRERFQHRQRLAFGDAGQHREIQFAHVFDHIHASGEFKVLHFKLFHQLIAFVGIVLVVHTTEDVQPDIVHAVRQFAERVDEGFHVLDGSQTYHGADIHPTVLRLERNVAEPFVLDAVGNDQAFACRSAHVDLGLASATEQAGHTPCPTVDLL